MVRAIVSQQGLHYTEGIEWHESVRYITEFEFGIEFGASLYISSNENILTCGKLCNAALLVLLFLTSLPTLLVSQMSIKDLPETLIVTSGYNIISRKFEAKSSSHVLNLVYLVRRLLIGMCSVRDKSGTGSSCRLIVTYFLNAATAATAVSLPRHMASTRYSSTSSNVPTVPICASLGSRPAFNRDGKGRTCGSAALPGRNWPVPFDMKQHSV